MEKILLFICFLGASIHTFGQNSKAVRLYNEALNILQEGEESIALTKLEQAVELDSTFIKARYNLGLLYREMAKLDLADKHFSVIIRQQPTFPKAYVLRGRIRLESYRLNEALSDFNIASQMFPKDYDAWHGLGSVHFMYENYEGAEEFFTKALNIFPEFPACYNDRASARLMLGKWDQAGEDYKFAVNFMPENARYRNNNGMYLLRKNDINGAINEFLKARELGEELEISSNMLLLCFIAKDQTLPDSLSNPSDVYHLNAANNYTYNNQSELALQLNAKAANSKDADFLDFQCLQKIRLLISLNKFQEACLEIPKCNAALEYKNIVCK